MVQLPSPSLSAWFIITPKELPIFVFGDDPLWPWWCPHIVSTLFSFGALSIKSGMVWTSLQLFENMKNAHGTIGRISPLWTIFNSLKYCVSVSGPPFGATVGFVTLRRERRETRRRGSVLKKCCRIQGTKDPQRLYAVVCANRWEGKLCWNWFVCTSQQHLNYSSFWNRICCGGVYICPLCICWCFD